MPIMPLMNGRVKLLRSVVVLMVFCWQPAQAFGRLGHRLAGEVAVQYLCEPAKLELQQLNGKYPFVTAGIWADKVRYKKEWRYTSPWHYMNVEADVFTADTPRSPKGDVLFAINKYRAQLASPDSSFQERRYAMLFLVHFVVDVHQPLHVGYQEDLGGNKVAVLLDGKATNLHSVWDTALLQSEDQSIQDYTVELLALSAGNVAIWQAAAPEVWVQESLDVRPEVYSYPAPKWGAKARLSDSYMTVSKEIIDIRLAQAGVRLAGELNAIWCPAGLLEP
jgi:hypothetical protein